MIISKAVAVQQANSLLHLYNYRKLKICTMEETEIVLAGSILINRSAKGFQLCKEYSVKIVIPLESEKLPYILDVGNHIDCNYPHRYLNGKLCLETDTSIRVRFVDGFSLEAWLEEFVEPYYFSYEFYQRYGEFPFGERGHDWEGIIQTYSDYGSRGPQRRFETTAPAKNRCSSPPASFPDHPRRRKCRSPRRR